MKELIAVAKELNELLGFNPPMQTKNITEEALTALVVEAAEEIWTTDDVTKETVKFLKALDVWHPKLAPASTDAEGDEEDVEADDADEDDEEEDVPAPAPKAKAKAKPAPVEDDDDDEDVEPTPKAKPAPAAKAPAKAKPAPVEEEDDDEDAQVEDEQVEDDGEESIAALIEKVQLTGKLTSALRAGVLKKLVNESELLSKFQKTVATKFDSSELKNEILEFLVKAERKAGKLASVSTPAPAKGKASMTIAKDKAKPVKPVVEEDDDDEEDEAPVPVAKAKAKAAKPEKVVKEKVVKEKFNRLDCVLIALKEQNPKTITDWIKKANALHVAKGGVDNEKQTKHLVVNYGASLKHLGITVPTEK